MKYLLRIILFLLKIYTGYYFFWVIFKLLRKVGILHTPQKFPVIYYKEIPFHQNIKAVSRWRLFSQFLFTIFITSLIFFILLNNLAPLGVTMHYSLQDGTGNISSLGPPDRVYEEIVDGQKNYNQSHNVLYFSTKMPFTFDSAKIKILFQNTDPEQSLSVGFKDQENWHYDTTPIDVPMLTSLPWQKITTPTGDTLYQQTPQFSSVSDFLTHPPMDALIGTYDYDPGIGNYFHLKLSDYIASSSPTIINTPLRGSHVIFAYLDHEPFDMKIVKQDLNWYEDPDVMTIKIYKNNILVSQTTVDDDGIQDNSKRVGRLQEVEIKNPGPEFPESGVYKIVINANNDTVIKKITTNLHKIVFSGSIFPVANSTLYPHIVATTSATTVFTNALTLSAKTFHDVGQQTLTVGEKSVLLSAKNMETIIIPQNSFTKIEIPQNDILLKGYWGYFAFTPDQFFIPTPYKTIPIENDEDIGVVDYIMTNYIPPEQKGDWKIAERAFDIRSAYIQNGILSWIIQAPQLQENNRHIIIKDISITFIKHSWF